MGADIPVMDNSEAFPLIRYIEKFPLETWNECWSYSCFSALRSLASTCRLFRDLCQPRIFRCLSFCAPSPYAINNRNCSDHILIVGLAAFRLACLLKAASLTPVVHMWEFHNNRGLQVPILSTRGIKKLQETVIPTNLFIRTLPVFSNMRTLNLSNINVDSDYQARESFASLRHLNALYLSHCNFSAQTGPLLLLLNIFGIFIYEDCELEDESVEPTQLPLPNNLTNVTIESRTHAWELFPALATLAKFERLTSLRVRVPDGIADMFFAILYACPNLRSQNLGEYVRLPRRNQALF